MIKTRCKIKKVEGMNRISSRINIPEILKRFIDLQQSVNMKSEILSRLRELLQSVSGASISAGTDNKKHKSYQSKIETHVIKILSLEESLKNDMDELAKLTQKTLIVLDKIDDVKCKELLTYRYLCGNTWEQVAEQMNYSYIHVLSRLHPRALRLIENAAGLD